jgi:hypothetical protein
MKVKPKEIFVNLPMVLMFSTHDEIAQLAANINQIIFGKVKVKCEELGVLGNQHVGIFYLQRNDEFTELRQQFVTMIETEEVENYNKKSQSGNSMFCEHANEVPGKCKCDNDCYCKDHTCKNKNGHIKNTWNSKEHSVLLYLLSSIVATPDKSNTLLEVIRETHNNTASEKLLGFLERLDDASYDTALLLSTAADIREEIK